MKVPARAKIVAALVTAGIVVGLLLCAPAADAKTRHNTHHAAVKKHRAGTTHRHRNIRKAAYTPPHAAIVIDADTGAVLSQDQPDRSVHPASLTKLMTLLLTFERIENGTLSLNQRLEISNHAAAQQPSKLGIPAGSSIPLRDAIYVVVTRSANDIAMAIAENIGGSEDHFVYMMNQKAKALGMTRTRFMNPNGLNAPAQVTTARDFALLSRYIVKTYPREYRYFSTNSYTYDGIVNRNHNHLMQTYEGMDGIKTGYISSSGFNLAASAVRNGHRLIAIVFGGKTPGSRNQEVARLLDDGFAKLNRNSEQLVAQGTVPLPDARLVAMSGTAAAARPAPAAKPVRVAAASEEDDTRFQIPANSPMSEMAGQGDIDPAAEHRFETGMMAIAAVKGTLKPGQVSPAVNLDPAQAPTPAAAPVLATNNIKQNWAVQLGSYTSRAAVDSVIASAISRLPANIRNTARPAILPMKAGQGWVYRAQLTGMTREQATTACGYFNDCIALSPGAL